MQEEHKDRLIDKMARTTPMAAAAALITGLRKVGRAVSAARVVKDLLAVTTALKKAMRGRTLDLEDGLREDLRPSYRKLRQRIRRSTVTKKNAVLKKIKRTRKI